MAGKKIGAVLALDGEKEFKKGIQESVTELKVLNSESKKIAEQFKGQANTVEALSQKQDVLNRILEETKKKQEETAKGLQKANENYNKNKEHLDKLSKELTSAKKKQEEMKKSGAATAEQMKEQADTVKAYEEEVKRQQQYVEKSGKSVKDWQKKLNDADTAVIKASRDVDQNAEYLKEAEESTDGCAKSLDEYGKQIKQAAEGTEKFSESADGLSESAEKTTEVTTSLGEKIGQALVTKGIDVAVDAFGHLKDAAVDAGKFAVDVGSEFEAGMSEVAAISGASGTQLEALTNKAKELGSSTKFSASEAASALTNMSLAGWTVDQSLAGIDGVLQLAAASGMDLAEASQAVTDNISAFNLEASDASQIADMMAFAQANSSTTAAELAQSYKNCAANMHSAGQDIETTTSILEILANDGLRGAEAGTALAAMMRDMTSKMDEGSIAIGDASVAVMDSNGKFRDMTDILKDVETATDGMGDAQKQAALLSTFTADSIKGLNMLLSTGADTTAEYEEKLRNCSGAASDMAAVMNDNLKGKLTELNSAVEGLGIAAYEQVSDYLQPAVEGVTEVVSALTEAITPEKDLLDDLVEKTRGTSEQITKEIESADGLVESANKRASSIETLGEKLIALNGIENKSTEQKWEMHKAVNELATEIPEVAQAYDEEKSSVNLTTAEIKGLITEKKNLLKVEALQAAKSDLIGAYADAKQNYADAEVAIGGLQEKLKELDKQYTDLKDKGADDETLKVVENWIDTVKDQITEQENVMNDSIKQMEECEKKAKSYGDAYEELESRINSSTEAQGELNKELVSTARNLATPLSEVNSLSDALKKNGEASKDTAESILYYNDATKDAGDTAEETAEQQAEAAKKALDVTRSSIDAQRDAIQSITETFESYKETAKSALSFDFFADEFDGGLDKTVEKMLENSKTQLKGLQDYEKNLAVVKNHVGKEIAPEFMEYLESMGTDAANILNHIAITFEQDNGAELVKEWSDNYVESADVQDRMATVMAANQIATENGLKELSSTPVDFSDLRNSINYAVETAVEGWDTLTDSTRQKLTETIQAAEDMGIQIPEGLAEGIENGSASPEEALAQLQGAIAGRKEGFLNIAKELGVEVGDEITKGLASDNSEEVAEAFQKLISLIANSSEEMQKSAHTAGENSSSETAKGIKSKSSEVEDAGKEVATKGAEAAETQKSEYETAGGNLVTSMATGVTNNQSVVETAALAAAQAGANAAGGDRSGWENAGLNLILGASDGIISGTAELQKAAVETIRKAKTAAENEAQIHSPSMAWRKDIGQNMTKGAAVGLTDEVKTVETAVETVMGAAKKSAEKSVQKVSIGNEARKIVKKVKDSLQKELTSGLSVGTIGKISANFSVSRTKTSGSKTQTKTDEEFSSEVFSKAQKYLSSIDGAYNVSLAKQKEFWKAVKKNLKAGTEGYLNAEKQIKTVEKEIKEERKKSNDTILSNAETYISHRQSLNNISAQDEIKFWKTIKASVTKGSDAWYSAIDNIKSARNRVISDGEKYVERQKANNNMSAAQEVEYWKKIKSSLKKGTDAWYEAQDNIDNARNNMISEGEKYISRRKSQNDISAEDEVKYWEKIKKTLKKGTDAWYDACDKVDEAKERLVSSWSDYVDKQKSLGNMSAREETEYWKKRLGELEKGGKKYSDAWYTVLGNINTARNDIISETEDYVNKQKTIGKMTDAQELAYWEKILASLEEGTDAWYEAYKKVKDLRKDIKDETEKAADDAKKKAQDEITKRASVQDKILSSYKTYYKTSERAEMQYWDIARKQFKEGTDERIAADQKYYDAKQAYYDRLEELDQEYVDNTKSVNDQLKTDIESTTKDYEDAVKNRSDSIKSSFGLFDSFYSESASGKQLMQNLKSQVAGIADWEKEIAVLSARGLSEGLMTELREMGPQAAASIQALNSLTAEELAEYDRLWNQRNALADSQAEKENQGLKAETEKKIEQLKKDAQTKLDEYTKTYQESISEATKGISEDLKKLANAAATAGEDAVAGMVANIATAADAEPVRKQIEGAVKTVSSELGKLEDEGKIIGTETLNQILESLGNDEVVNAGAKTMFEKLREAIKREGGLMFEDYNITGMDAAAGRMNDLASATMTQNLLVSANSPTLESKLDILIALSSEYFPQMAENDTVLDGEVISKKLEPKINKIMAQKVKSIR